MTELRTPTVSLIALTSSFHTCDDSMSVVPMSAETYPSSSIAPMVMKLMPWMWFFVDVKRRSVAGASPDDHWHCTRFGNQLGFTCRP